MQPVFSVQPTVLVELQSNNDYTNDHNTPYPSKVRGLGSLIILTIKILTNMNTTNQKNYKEKSYEEMTDEDFALANKETFEELVIEYEDLIDALESLSNSLGFEIDSELEVPYEEEQMNRLEKMYERVNMAHGALESLNYEE